MLFATPLTPLLQGLVEQNDLSVFTFTADHIPRSWNVIEAVAPGFAEELRAFKAKQDASNKHSDLEDGSDSFNPRA